MTQTESQYSCEITGQNVISKLSLDTLRIYPRTILIYQLLPAYFTNNFITCRIWHYFFKEFFATIKLLNSTHCDMPSFLSKKNEGDRLFLKKIPRQSAYAHQTFKQIFTSTDSCATRFLRSIKAHYNFQTWIAKKIRFRKEPTFF